MGLWILYHPSFVPERWQIFVVYLIVVWLSTAIVLFGQRILARFSNAMAIICILVWLVNVLVCLIMPSTTGYGHASHSFVWTEWQNTTGWSSNGFVFLAGMLNGAFTIGTPDGCTHRKFSRSCAYLLPCDLFVQLLKSFPTQNETFRRVS